MQYSTEQVEKLIGEVEKEFHAVLAKAEEEASQELAKSQETAQAADAILAEITDKTPAAPTLAKAEEGPAEPKKEEEHKEKEEPEHSAEAKEDSKEESKEEPKEEEKEHSEHDEEHHGYDDADMEEMHKMYDSMHKGELKAHHAAIQKCWMAKCGDMSHPMAKSELAEAPKAEAEDLKKSEELSTLKSQLDAAQKAAEEIKLEKETLQKSFNAVEEFLTKLAKKSAPQGKAITSLDIIQKSEVEAPVLTKNEVSNILAKKTSDPSLSKADRDAINAYYLSNAPITTISHLLK